MRPRGGKTSGIVQRFFVCNERGEVYDGPFKFQSQVEDCADEYRKVYGYEPVITQMPIHPIPQGWYEGRYGNGRESA